MSYQLGWPEAMRALFVPFEASLWLGLAVPAIIMAILYWREPRSRSHPWLMLSVALGLPLILVRCGAKEGVGAGWKLAEHRLELRAWPVEEELDLSTASIALEGAASPWQPARRTYGFGVPGMATGWFELRNGKKAVVFYHQSAERVLVVQTRDRCYVLAHPGVEALYEELVARGISVRPAT